MNYQGFLITALDDSLWGGWPAAEYGKTGMAFRRLRSGQKHSIRIPSQSGGAQLAVLSLAEPPYSDPAKHWHITFGGQSAKLYRRKTFPKHLLLELPESGSGDHAELIFEPIGSAKQGNDLLIEEVAIMPRAGRFSELWTSPWRALKKLTSKQSLPWAPADFPYSHFDGLGYLLDHDEVRQAVLSRKYDTAFRYWYTKGRHRGHPLPLAVHREPLPGTPFNLVMHYQGEYGHMAPNYPFHGTDTAAELKEENELLLLQLHQVQEELETYFLENKQLKESQEKHAALKSEHSELETRHSSLVAEHNALKKTASERTMRIAELEAQVAEQAERQRQIDEEMTKADGQLQMLKELLRSDLV
jgi:hypothetical protein